jgi:SMI1 / KNR4 family (SUKH-1)
MNEIVKKLKALKDLDVEFKVFGSGVHQYKLMQPLSIRDFTIVEEKYSCQFPEDYRHFITTIGNGGAGPYYGLLPIEMDDAGDSWDKGYLVGDLTKPFRHSETWNLPESFWKELPDPPAGTPPQEEDLMNEEWDKKLEKEYWNTDIVSGAIPICHEGCAIRNWLVIMGSEMGTIWRDLRVDYQGLIPLKNQDGSKVTFKQWYLNWLDESLNKFANVSQSTKKWKLF